MTEKAPLFVRGQDGFLRRNPKVSIWGKRNYSEPSEALMQMDQGKERFGCIHRRFESYSSFPCNNTAKHDLDVNGNPTKCGHHSQASKDRKKEKSDAKMQEWRDRNEAQNLMRSHLSKRDEIIRSIADGHNDPRGLCQEWLDGLDALKTTGRT